MPILKQMCTDSFEAECGIAPDEAMSKNEMGSELEKSIQEDNVGGWAIYDGDALVGGEAIVLKEDRTVLGLFFIDEKQMNK